jgi:WD40 repeat protein
VWTIDGTRLLSGGTDSTIQQWDSSTWTQVGDWDVRTKHPVLAMNCNGTIVASIIENHVRLWRLSDWRTIAIFQHSNPPGCITFSVDGKHIIAGSIDKIFEWAVPEHAWPENASEYQATYQVC